MTTKNWNEEANVSEQLAYLTGDTATREKVRWFLEPQGRSGNYSQNIYYGLFIARNRGLALQLLEAALRDSSIPATYQLLQTTVALRLLNEGAIGVGAWGLTLVDGANQPKSRSTQLKEDYVRELSASLLKRTGPSRTTTAITILQNLPADRDQAALIITSARDVLVKEFEALHPFTQENLLRTHWDQIKDPALIPSIERILTDKKLPQAQLLRNTALGRIRELAPERARPFFVAEISDPESLADFEVLTALDALYLPEVDQALLKQIGNRSSLKPTRDSLYLKHKASLAARFATAEIYEPLMELYQAMANKWPADVRASFLAYFVRHNESQAIPMVEQTLREIGAAQYFNFLPHFTKLYYSDAVDALMRKLLESDEPEAVNTVSYVMSLHGPESDRQFLESRLARWQKEWTKRVPDLDADESDANVVQSMVQVNLISALITAKGWKLAENEIIQLKEKCISRICRQHFQAQR